MIFAINLTLPQWRSCFKFQLIVGHLLLEIEETPNYPNQKMYILEIDNYAIVVPFVETEKEIFLKTAFPSRKYTKQFKLTGDHE